MQRARRLLGAPGLAQHAELPLLETIEGLHDLGQKQGLGIARQSEAPVSAALALAYAAAVLTYLSFSERLDAGPR